MGENAMLRRHLLGAMMAALATVATGARQRLRPKRLWSAARISPSSC